MAASSLPRRVAGASLAIAALLAGSGHARADEASAVGVVIGARVGLALPGGRYESTTPATSGSASTARSLSDDVTSGVPFSLLVGLRTHAFLFAARGSYAQVSAAPIDCSNAEPCGRSTNGPGLRGVLDAQYRAAMPTVLQPWAGIGVGVERLTGGSTRYWGPVLEANLGADHTFASGWRLGPYLGVSAGQFVHAYSSRSTAYMGQVFGADSRSLPADRYIPDRAWHAWIELGVQGAFSR